MVLSIESDGGVFCEVMGKRSRADTHRPRGISLRGRHLECPADRLALDPFDVLPELQRWNRGRLGCGCFHGNGITSDDGSGRQDDGSLDRVLELAYVTWPRIFLEPRNHAVLHCIDRSVVPRGVFVDEILHKHRDVVDAFAKRRHDDRNDVQTIKEVMGSPFPSGGSAPISLTVSGDLVYVANQAPPFANPAGAPNLIGFRIDASGRLTPLANSMVRFPKGQGPAQVEFSPGGETVAVTSGFQDAATSRVHGYKVQTDGTLKEGPGSPAHAMNASGDVGFSWNPEGTRVYVANFRGNAVTVFDINKHTGGVSQVGETYPTQGSAACWTAISSDGKTLYVANYVSNSISAFTLQPDGGLTLLGTTMRRGATTPDTKDLVIEKDGKYLYAIASGARAIAAFSIGPNGALTELPAGQSPVKLSAGQNILGLASN